MAVVTLLEAIREGLREEMRINERVVVFGEDVALNGGVFRTTEGLLKEFGEDRVFDTPLAEGGIIGVAIGMALYGLRPVPEIQFLDFIYPAFDQIVSELAKFRYRSGGEFTTPVVIRAPYGGGIKGGHYHSQSAEAYFAHTPGLKIVIPSTPYDAKGLLRSAIRDDDPVLFLEPKRIYRSVKEDIPAEEYTVPIGASRIVQDGVDITVLCYGAMVHVAAEAAQISAKKGYSVEVIDLRTLIPLDIDRVLDSVRKTGRVVIVHEAPKTCGYGSELSAIIAEKSIEFLECPIYRVCGFDTPFPYTLEHVYLPDAERVAHTIDKAMKY